jgi:hypothetical protein
MALNLGTTALAALYLGSTAISTAYLGSVQVYDAGGAPAFDPASLFASGEEGVWYEPSTSTAFLSTTDLTPCDYGQACGFLLDKSQGAGYSGGSFTGLGSELVTNGTFDSDISGWTEANSATATYSSGRMRVAGDGSTSFPYAYQSLSGLTVGKHYLVSGDIFYISGTSGAQIQLGAAGFGFPSGSISSGTFSFVWLCDRTTVQVRCLANAANSVYEYDNVTFKELPGNHATQGTAASRPTLARVPEGGRRNLLERTEEFDNAVWVKGGVSVTANATTAPDGATTADLLYPLSSGNNRWVYQTESLASNLYVRSVYAKAAGKNFLLIDPIGSGTAAAYFDLSTGTVGTVSAGYTANIESVGNGWYRCSIVNISAQTLSFGGVYAVVDADNSRAVTADGTSGIYLWGAQIEEASSASNYQRVSSEYDITEAGVDSLDYLSFDGVDDVMQSANTNWAATQTAWASAGASSSDGAAATCVVFGVSNGFYSSGAGGEVATLSVFSASGNRWNFADVGAATDNLINASPDITAPNVLTGYSDASNAYLRRNGSQVATAATNISSAIIDLNKEIDLGAWNAPEFGGTGFINYSPLNLFGLIIRLDPPDAGELSNTETYLANRSGVTLA